MWGGISALAVATGPSLGSVLIDAGGWRWAFFVNLPVAAGRGRRDHGGWSPSRWSAARRPTWSASPCSRSRWPPLALGITQGDDWGWTSPAVLGAFVASVVLGAAALCAGLGVHPAPAIDLRLFENRTVALANAATVAYAVGFFAMLLANVLFLTDGVGLLHPQGRPRHHARPAGGGGAVSRSTGRAGRPHRLPAGARRRQPRVRHRAAVVRGPHAARRRTTWAAGCPPACSPASAWPSSFPVLSAAAVAGLPADRFGVGGALNQTARQMGAVLGVALLVSILGTPTSPAEALDAFQHAWLLCAGAGVLAAVISSRQRRVEAVTPSPAAVAVEPVTA